METTAKAWQCELPDCGRIWLAKDSTPPRLCPGCKKTGWHKTASTRELVRESTLDDRIRETVEVVLQERLPGLLAELRESAPVWSHVAAGTLPPSPLASLPVEDRRAAVLASVAGLGVTTAGRMDDCPEELRASVPVPLVADPAEPSAPCPYTEPDYETGFVHACPLRLHHKGKHVRGPKVGDIY
jgi:hypothetical protein